MAQLVTLQQTLITLLQRSTEAKRYDVLPNHIFLLSTSDTVRASVIQSLAAQFQRLSQAATIVKAPKLNESVCRGKLGKHRWSTTRPQRIEYPCRLCRTTFTPLDSYHSHKRLYIVGALHISVSALAQEHLEDEGGIECLVCSNVSGIRTFDHEIMSIVQHLDIHEASYTHAAYSSGGTDSNSRQACVLM